MATPAAPGAHTHIAEPCVIVIFGASGDLTHRKLIPSLYDLERQGVLPRGTVIVGVSRTPLTDDQFREKLGLQPAEVRSGMHVYPIGFEQLLGGSLHYFAVLTRPEQS